MPLSSPVPVYLWYRTTWIDARERIQFRKDVYGWDEVLANVLKGNPPLVPKSLQLVLRGRRGKPL